jgi:hypothetical protein
MTTKNDNKQGGHDMKKMNTLVDLALAQINNSINEKPPKLPASVKEKRRRLKAIKAKRNAQLLLAL